MLLMLEEHRVKRKTSPAISYFDVFLPYAHDWVATREGGHLHRPREVLAFRYGTVTHFWCGNQGRNVIGYESGITPKDATFCAPCEALFNRHRKRGQLFPGTWESVGYGPRSGSEVLPWPEIPDEEHSYPDHVYTPTWEQHG